MFTGIVEELGEIREVRETAATRRLTVGAAVTRDGSELGASVAINGVCLTVVERTADGFAFDVGPETLERTALTHLVVGDRVNLERPLRLGAALGGHLVLGHVDGVSLTVATLDDAGFEVMLIPHTLEVTNLGRLTPGRAVNIETDLIGKYVLRSLALRGTA